MNIILYQFGNDLLKKDISELLLLLFYYPVDLFEFLVGLKNKALAKRFPYLSDLPELIES